MLISATDVYTDHAKAGETQVTTQLAQSSNKITEDLIAECSTNHAETFKRARGYAAPAGLTRSYCECGLNLINLGDTAEEAKAFCLKTVYPKYGL
jgi:hypothetical protein